MAIVNYDPRFVDRISPELLRSATEGLDPIDELRDELDDTSEQKVVPFLGAGASLKGEAGGHAPQAKHCPTPEQVDQICADFEIKQPISRLFISAALQLAQMLDSVVEQPMVTVDDKQAPSSWELANLLTTLLRSNVPAYPFEPFERYADQLLRLLPCNSSTDSKKQKANYLELVQSISELLNLRRSIPELLTVASYFGGSLQDTLRSEIRLRFDKVKEVTNIQQSLVQKAKNFVKAQNEYSNSENKPDYLFITTNYDCLLEDKLQSEGVPTCVVTVDLTKTVNIQFFDAATLLNLEGAEKDEFGKLVKKWYFSKSSPLAKDFEPAAKPYSLAMVYKLHGCPRIDAKRAARNIVISDSDYVRFMQYNGETASLVPKAIFNTITKSKLLFLGYSFSDWNVRGLYQWSWGSNPMRDTESDVVVMRSFLKTDQLFFSRYPSLTILVTDLDTFADKIAHGR